MKSHDVRYGFTLVLTAGILLVSAAANAEVKSVSETPKKVDADAPIHQGLILDFNVSGRMMPLLGGGVGLLPGAKLDRFTLGAGLDVFMPPGPRLLMPRLEAQAAFVQTPDRRVEILVLAGFAWTFDLDAISKYDYSSKYVTWAPFRMGLGIRHWSSSKFGVYFHVGLDISPYQYGHSDGEYSFDGVSFSPFARLGIDFAIGK